MGKIMIIDTNIMCVWLKVPGKTNAGTGNMWNYENVSAHIEEEIRKGTKLCLPMTSVIETGNHIAHATGNKAPSADELKNMIIKSAKGNDPWVVFEYQNWLWEADKLTELATTWNEEVKQKEHALGDAIIVEIAKHYSSLNFDVEIFTGDNLLKDYERKIVGQEKKKKLRRNRGK
jgi:hypothetical protein